MFSVGSFFAGCGGLDFGFLNSGFDLLWSNELEASFGRSYESLTNHDCQVGDFWDVSLSTPDTDVIIGGPPCQSFSLAGLRLADDPRGKLVAGFMDVIIRKKPQAFLMENVQGITSSKYEGRPLLDYVREVFTLAGYSCSVVKVDASDYFVPQRRKRIILVGMLKAKSEFQLITSSEFRDTLIERTGLQWPATKIDVKSALDDLPAPNLRNASVLNAYASEATNPYQQLLRIDAPISPTLHFHPTMSQRDASYVKHIPPGGNYEDIPVELETPRITRIKVTGGRTTCYGRLHPDRPAYTINTYFNRPNVGANYHHAQERLITVREALRLQSFPDFFEPTFLNQRELHTQIGNAVPPLLGEALAISLRRWMERG
jgi:DNA (cytosine-5)-methyltransferase 1